MPAPAARRRGPPAPSGVLAKQPGPPDGGTAGAGEPAGAWAERWLRRSGRTRGAGARSRGVAFAVPAGEKRRTVYDAQGGTRPPFRLVRSEGHGPVDDQAVNEAYDGAGATYDLYRQA